MELVYKISIGAIFLLGIAHVGFTFVKYPKIGIDALWFMSAGMGLFFNGLINFLNLTIADKLTNVAALGANILLVMFAAALLVYKRNAQIISLVLLSLLLLVSTIF